MPYFKVKIEGVSDSTGKTIVHSNVYQSKDASALAEVIRQEMDLDRDKNPSSVYIEFLREDEPVEDDASWGMSSEGLNVGCDFASGVCYQWRDPWSGEVKMIRGKDRQFLEGQQWTPEQIREIQRVNMQVPNMAQRYDDDKGAWVPIETEWGYL